MPSSSVAVRGLVLAALAIGTAPAFAQDIVVQPARVPVAGAPGTYERSLPPPPPGPIESRLVSVPAGPAAPSVTVPATPPPAAVFASTTPTVVTSTQPSGPFGTVTFIGRSAALTPATKAELDQIARRIADQKLRHIELRAFAPDTGPDSRKIALARALVVRSYLIDKGVKSRIEVGSFSGDGDAVEILVPNT
ncbi:Outer membrane protein OmpA [Rhodospirillales bacterium URHD0017]|nr:Outer membrane protein OmpA [Rhodospirillales bacterium URHD0017]